MTASKYYRGKLARPMRPKPTGPKTSDSPEQIGRPNHRTAEQRAADAKAWADCDAWAEEQFDRVLLLGTDLGVKTDNQNIWKSLFFALAERHVPGLRTARRRGPKMKKIGSSEEIEASDRLLTLLTERRANNPRLSQNDVLKKLLSRPNGLPSYYRNRPKRVSLSLLKADVARAKQRLPRRQEQHANLAKALLGDPPYSLASFRGFYGLSAVPLPPNYDAGSGVAKRIGPSTSRPGK